MKCAFRRQGLWCGLLTLCATGAFGVGALVSTGAVWPVAPVVTQLPAEESAPPLDPESPAVQQAVDQAKSLSLAFRAAAERVLPAVVSIENRPKPTAVAATSPAPFSRDENPFAGTPFEDLFRDLPMQPNFRGGIESPAPSGIGSGVIFDTQGWILTNSHVVEGDGLVKVRLNDGREFEATQVYRDPLSDIAVIKIEASGLPAANLGNSEHLSVGDWVIALGQPYGLESSVTAGIISAKHRGVGITARANFLQTDAAINPGNSGGPLVDLSGKVVGINTAITTRSGGNDGIGFSVPINQARWVAEQLTQHGRVQRAYLGVGIQPLSAELAQQFQVPPRQGVLVTEVHPRTPAEQAGLQSGDVITEFAGIRVHSPQELQSLVEQSEIGTRYQITVIRDGQNQNLVFTSESQPDDFGRIAAVRSRPGTNAPAYRGAWGLAVDQNSEAAGNGRAGGVRVIDVQAGSPAARAGLIPGMVIMRVNQVNVNTVEEFQAAVTTVSEDTDVMLLVRTPQGSRFVVLRT